MRVISIANQKGGCGKTTTAINLSSCLAVKGRKVLLIDMDPQGHSALGLNTATDKITGTVNDILYVSEGSVKMLDEVIVSVTENLDMAPSTISLSVIEQYLSKLQGRETRLKEAIDNLIRKYDYIIIDCPPSLGLLTFNALMASTEVIVPIEMSLFSLHGISRLMNIIELVRDRTGHELNLNVVATMFDKRTRISKEVLADIKKHFANVMFKTIINTNVKLKEAISFGKPIVVYDRKSQGSADYMALTNEVIAKEKHLGMELVKQKKTIVQKKQFVFHAPDASSVKIVGTFNDWDPSNTSTMRKEKEGVWIKNLDLPPGTYQYRFLVDEKWVEDKTNPDAVDNSFGGKNSVVVIR